MRFHLQSACSPSSFRVHDSVPHAGTGLFFIGQHATMSRHERRRASALEQALPVQTRAGWGFETWAVVPLESGSLYRPGGLRHQHRPVSTKGVF